MAQKKTKKKKSYRRRRIGAMSLTATNPIVKFAPIVAGFLFGEKLINAPLDKVIPTSVDKKMVAGGQVLLGAYLTFGKNPSVPKAIAGGLLLGSGVKRAIEAFGIGYIGGYGSVPVIGSRMINGYGSVPVIGSGARRVGAYSTNGQLGAYSVPNNTRVMSGIGSSGSGYMNAGTSMMQ